jgi:hypothetical protein
MVILLFVGREKSIQTLDAAMRADKRITIVAQKQPDVDDPKAGDLYGIGTIATILQLLKLPGGTVKVLIEGADRARIERMHDSEHYAAHVVPIPDSGAYDEGRHARPLRDFPVRAIRQAQQEGTARGAYQARRHRARGLGGRSVTSSCRSWLSGRASSGPLFTRLKLCGFCLAAMKACSGKFREGMREHTHGRVCEHSWKRSIDGYRAAQLPG